MQTENIADFATFRAANPEASFSDYYIAATKAKLDKGIVLSSIGAKTLPTSGVEKPFNAGGAAVAQRYIRILKLKPTQRIVDYGCGSLRVGSHLIDYLNPGRYFGMDVSGDFIDIGKDQIGAAVARKKPRFAQISPDAIQDGAVFAPHVVISHSVHYHVHPDQQPDYFANLDALAVRPKARIVLSVKVSDAPIQFSEFGWAWPLRHFIDSLPGLVLSRSTRLRPLPKRPHIAAGTLIFTRPR